MNKTEFLNSRVGNPGYFANYDICYTYGEFTKSIENWGRIIFVKQYKDTTSCTVMIKFNVPINTNVDRDDKLIKSVWVNLSGGNGICESPFILCEYKTQYQGMLFGNEYIVVKFDPMRVFWGGRGNHAELYNDLFNFLELVGENKSILNVFRSNHDEHTRIPLWGLSGQYKIPDDFQFDIESISNETKCELVSLYLRRFGNKIIKNGFYRGGNTKCVQPNIKDTLKNFGKENMLYVDETYDI